MEHSDVFDEYCELAKALRSFDRSQLETDNERFVFWINTYNVLAVNGVIAYQVKHSIEEICGQFERIAYIIGGLRYSLDDIENGILRANFGHVAIPGGGLGIMIHANSW